MSAPVFLHPDLTAAAVGDEVVLAGEEGRHAVVVRRLRVGERIVLADGAGHGVAGAVVRLAGGSLVLVVEEVLRAPSGGVRFVVAQALVKGDRAELAVELMTEVGVHEIVPWSASRSVVRWSAERGDRGLARWRSSVREAAKQARRLQAPDVNALCSTAELAGRLAAAAVALVLHEEASTPIAAVGLPSTGDVVLVVGPEGGVSPEELEAFVAAGAQPVRVSDHVLRASTAGVVALAALLNR